MPSFDVVSEVDVQEVRNAIDQAHRELTTRFDFKGTDTTVEFKDDAIELESASEERLKAATQVLEEKLVRRKVSLKALDYGKVEEASQGPGPPEGHAAVGDQRREGARDRQVHQGSRAQGRAAPGAGNAAARDRQEARRPAVGDPVAARARLRRAARLHELPRLTCASVEERAHRNFCDWTALERPPRSRARRRSTSRGSSRSRDDRLPDVAHRDPLGLLAPGRAVGRTTVDDVLRARRQDRVRARAGRHRRRHHASSCSSAASASGRRRPEMVCEHALEPRDAPAGVTVRFAATPADISAYARIVGGGVRALDAARGVTLAAVDHPDAFLADDCVVALAEIDGDAGRGRAGACSFDGGRDRATSRWVVVRRRRARPRARRHGDPRGHERGVPTRRGSRDARGVTRSASTPTRAWATARSTATGCCSGSDGWPAVRPSSAGRAGGRCARRWAGASGTGRRS